MAIGFHLDDIEENYFADQHCSSKHTNSRKTKSSWINKIIQKTIDFDKALLYEDTKEENYERNRIKMNENYIMLNGKRVDLTDEQIEKLGFKVEKDCFERLQNGQRYYHICGDGNVSSFIDIGDSTDDKHYKVANYCTDKSLMQQRALHEILDRLLWRFSMQNDGDKVDWNEFNSAKYTIHFNHNDKHFDIKSKYYQQFAGCIYFNTKEIAQRAIDEIIKPFMKEHPDFVW